MRLLLSLLLVVGVCSANPQTNATDPYDSMRCGSMRNGVEVTGTVIKTLTLTDAFYGACCEACRHEPGCKAGVMPNANTCTLLSTVDGERYDPTFAVSSVMVYPKDYALGYLCMPTEDNIDYYGNDYKTVFKPTTGECCDVCTQDQNCGAYTWTKWNGGACFLKYAKASSVKKAPLADGSAYFRSGEIYRCQPLRQKTDFVGEDLLNKPAKTPSECCALCHLNWPCQAFSWSNYNGGTCWLKKKAASSITKDGVVSATVY